MLAREGREIRTQWQTVAEGGNLPYTTTTKGRVGRLPSSGWRWASGGIRLDNGRAVSTIG